MAKQRILVTGGSGFIGSHLADHHLRKGNEVWAVDNLHTGRISNIEPFMNNPLFRFSQADLRSWPSLKDACRWADQIYHMAGYVGQRLIIGKPTETLSNNIKIGEALLEAMNEAQTKARLIISSTSELYFNSLENADGTVSEDLMVSFESGKFLQESYPLSKLVNEIMVLSYAYERGLNCRIARIFNTIGPNQCSLYGMVVPTFVEQALQQKPLTIFGDGLQTRSFSDVRDTVTALEKLLENPQTQGEIINVGNNKECSIIDLAHLVIKQTQSSSTIKYLSYEEAYGINFFIDVRRRCPNLDKLHRYTDFEHQWNLEQTIDSIIATKKKCMQVHQS